MDFNGMTNEEVFKALGKLESSGGLTLDVIDQAIASRSVVDPIANKDALTIFYSGEPGDLINKISEGKDPNIRIIRRTDAFKFVDDSQLEGFVQAAVEHDNPTLDAEAVKKEVGRRFYEASEYDKAGNLTHKGVGYWTEISRRFAKDTGGKSISLCSHASPTRIYAADELPTWIASADPKSTMCKVEQTELSKMDHASTFSRVQSEMRADFQDSIEYFDVKGNKVGQDFSGTCLDGRVPSVIPNDYLFAAKQGEYLTYADYGTVVSNYPHLARITDYDEKNSFISALRAYEYLKAKGADESVIAQLGAPHEKLEQQYGDEEVSVQVFQLKDKKLLQSGAIDQATLTGLGKKIDTSEFERVSTIGIACYQKSDAQIVETVQKNAGAIKSQIGTDVGLGTVLVVRGNAYFIDDSTVKQIPDFTTAKDGAPTLLASYSKDPVGTIQDISVRLEEQLDQKTVQVMGIIDTRSTGLGTKTEEEFLKAGKEQAEQIRAIVPKEPAVVIADTEVTELKPYVGKVMSLSEANKRIGDVKAAYDQAGVKGPMSVDIDTFSQGKNGVITKVGIRMDLNERFANVSEKTQSVLSNCMSKAVVPERKQFLSGLSQGFGKSAPSAVKGVARS